MIPYNELLKMKNTPFYVFDEQGFIDNYFALENAMKKYYPNYMISYSYKTNYTPYICGLVKKLGGFAEVVSDMEYSLAKKIGYENKEIIYNGPAKGKLLEEHLLCGGIINIDNFEEAQRIVEIVKRNKCQNVKVGIRLNLDISDSFTSRFGMQIESEEFLRTVSALKNNGIQISGLHCHISRHRNIEAWAKRAAIMISSADKYIGGIPEYISLGSGMYADMPKELYKQFSDVPTYDDYAKTVMKPFADKYGNNGPVVFTEPGTTLVARYISFLCRVLNIKKIKDDYFATTDGSFENLGEICTMKNLPITVVKGGKEQFFEKINIMGYTCLEQDVMYENYSGEIAVDDLIIFENVGGYSIVSKPQFIRPNCSMWAYSKKDGFKLIMREETFNDVFDKFVF